MENVALFHLHRIVVIFCILVLSVLSGFLIININSLSLKRWLSWSLLLITMTVTLYIVNHWPVIWRMISIILVLFAGMKIIVTAESQHKEKTPLTFKRWIMFSTGWVGMKPAIFTKRISANVPKGLHLIYFGISRLGLGIFIMGLVRLFSSNLPDYSTFSYYPITIFVLISLSLILHFGILTTLAGIWQIYGMDTKAIFKSPLASNSLQEFWGERWNIAFSEMTAISIFKPIAVNTNKSIALFAAFLFSGVLHELAISIPVKANYGLPSLYFLIQGIALIIESKYKNRILKTSYTARLWTFFWLIAPLPLLFHRPFVTEIIFPLIGLKF